METLKATVLLFCALFGGASGASMNKTAVQHVITVSGIVEEARVATAETSGYMIRLDKPVNAGIRRTCYLDIGHGCPDLKPFLKKRVTVTGKITGKRCKERGNHLVILLADIREQRAH